MNSLVIFINSMREIMTSTTLIMYSVFGMLIFSETIVFLTFIWGFFHIRLSNPFLLTEINFEAYSQISDTLNFGSVLISLVSHKIQEYANDEIDFLIEKLLVAGLMFLSLQNDEYSILLYSLNNYWITLYFFILTGLHSLHVYVGVVLLLLQPSLHEEDGSIRDDEFNIGMYWHFVEMIWIGLTVILFLV